MHGVSVSIDPSYGVGDLPIETPYHINSMSRFQFAFGGDGHADIPRRLVGAILSLQCACSDISYLPEPKTVSTA